MARYAELSASPTRGFRVLRFFQRLIRHIPQPLLGPAFRIYRSQPLVDFTFNAYLRMAPPGFATRTADQAQPELSATASRS